MSKIDRKRQIECYYAMKDGNEAARAELIESCIPLAVNLANKFFYSNNYIELDDLIQEAYIELIKAVDEWDITKGWLTTTATTYIRNALSDFVQNHKGKVQGCDLTLYAVNKIKKIKELGLENESPEVIKARIGGTTEGIKNLLRHIKAGRSNLDRLDEDDISEKGQSPYCLADLIKLSDETIEDDLERSVFLTWVDHIDKPNRNTLTAEKFGCSNSEVSEIVKKNKKLLKKALV
jgi:RNA polymerase sigma factor (sigma-70 family)